MLESQMERVMPCCIVLNIYIPVREIVSVSLRTIMMFNGGFIKLLIHTFYSQDVVKMRMCLER